MDERILFQDYSVGRIRINMKTQNPPKILHFKRAFHFAHSAITYFILYASQTLLIIYLLLSHCAYGIFWTLESSLEDVTYVLASPFHSLSLRMGPELTNSSPPFPKRSVASRTIFKLLAKLQNLPRGIRAATSSAFGFGEGAA